MNMKKEWKKKKIIHNKCQKFKEKYIKMIVVNVCIKKDKRRAVFERYDKIAHQQCLIQYQSSLEMLDKTMEDSIVAIQSGGDGNEQLLSFNVALKMQENALMDGIAATNFGGDIFIPTTMLEPLKKEVDQKYVDIKVLKQKILDNI